MVDLRVGTVDNQKAAVRAGILELLTSGACRFCRLVFEVCMMLAEDAALLAAPTA